MSEINQPLSILEVNHIKKTFGTFDAVTDLTFKLHPQETLGLLGPNGAGKTTTLRMLAGFLPPTQGEIFVNGFSLVGHPILSRKQIGYLPENVPLYLDMTVKEFLIFIANMKRLHKQKRKEELDRVLNFLSLESVESHLIGKLSKGFKQRVGLAQAILGKPKLILLDEPTSGLDPEQTVEMRQLIKKLNKDSSVILSTHLLSEVEKVADRVLIMNQGTILASGKPSELTDRLKVKRYYRLGVKGNDEKVMVLLKSITGVESVLKLKSLEEYNFYRIVSNPKAEILSQVLEKLVHDHIEIREMVEEESKLEDVFLALVRNQEKASTHI